MGCGAETEANTLMTTLTSDVAFVIPNIDLTGSKYRIPVEEGDPLYAPVQKMEVTQLTTGVGGTGTFDKIMKSVADHLRAEYDAGRITGAEYTKAYIAITESALSGGLQFLLNRETAFWQAQTAQIQAITAIVQNETAKMEYGRMQFEALTSKGNYALTKLKLASESMGYCVANYQLTTLLPKQGQLLDEQKEVQRAQTSDTRSDGVTPIIGVLGKQKALYDQQITSYQRDSEVKAAKLFTDAWITMKTMDEGVLPPNGFVNTSIDEVLTVLKTNNGFD